MLTVTAGLQYGFIRKFIVTGHMLVHPMRVRCRCFSGRCCQTSTFRSVFFLRNILGLKSNELISLNVILEISNIFLKSLLLFDCSLIFLSFL